MWEWIVEVLGEWFGGGEAAASGEAATAAEVATTATTTTTASGIAEAVAKMAYQFAISYAISSIFAKNPSIAHPDAQTFLGNGFSALDPIPVIYGQRRIGGTRAMIAVTASPGMANDILLLAMLWGEGEVNALKTIYFDGSPATDANANPSGIYVGYLEPHHHLGGDDQAADQSLVARAANAGIWNQNCKLSGVAYTAFTLGWHPDRYPNGRPTITVDIEGRKLYDPRTGLTAYSRNPALAIRDYLTNVRYGRGIPSSMIDDAAIIVAANYCDELVNLPTSYVASLVVAAGGSGYQVGDYMTLSGGAANSNAVAQVDSIGGGGAVATASVVSAGSYSAPSARLSVSSSTSHSLPEDPFQGTSGSGATFTATYATLQEPRYRCDGVVNVDQSPLDNLRSLLQSCRGFLVFSGGQYRLRVDKPETPVAFVLNEDNIIGGWQIQLGAKQNRFNRVRARFFNEAAEFVPDLAIFPAVGSAVEASWRAEDGGVLLEAAIDLPFTSSPYMATRICQTEARCSRVVLQVGLVATIAAMALEVGDVVPVAHATPGWPAASDPAEGKLFRVTEIELLSNDEVRLTLREYLAAAYTLDDQALLEAVTLTSLPDASSVSPPGAPSVSEALFETTGSAGVKSRATFSWGASADVWVQRGGFYELELRRAGAPTWTRFVVPQTSYVYEDLAPATYDARVRAVNSLGVRSAYSSTSGIELLGLTAPPANVSGFFVTVHEGRARMHLDLTTDLDVRQGGRLWVRWSPLTIGADLERREPHQARRAIRATRSSSRGRSTPEPTWRNSRTRAARSPQTEASFLVGEVLLTGFTTLATATFHPTFAGVLVNVAAIESGPAARRVDALGQRWSAISTPRGRSIPSAAMRSPAATR
jgi:hypothetical protein